MISGCGTSMRMACPASNPHKPLNTTKVAQTWVGVNPASSIKWWIWSRSAENGDLRWRMRRTRSTRQSITGTGSSQSASTGLTGCEGLWVRRNAIQAIAKPRKALPALPMNRVAFGRQGMRRLYQRKPLTAPARTMARSPIMILPEYSAAHPSINSAASTSDPASPSMPSTMLTALIKPTVANTVNGTDSQPSDQPVMPKAAPSSSTRTSPT